MKPAILAVLLITAQACNSDSGTRNTTPTPFSSKGANAESRDRPNVNNRFVVSVAGGDYDLPLRKRPLSASEIKVANGADGAGLNKETIITYIPNGMEVELIQILDDAYYIKAFLLQGPEKGYIVKNFRGKSTIKKVEQSENQ